MSFLGDIVHTVSKPFSPVVDEISDGASLVKDGVSDGVSLVGDGASLVGDGIRKGISKTGDAVKGAVNVIENVSAAAWEATSKEAAVIGHAVESTGLKIGPGMVAGAKAVASLAEKGVELTDKGLVAMGNYVSSHVCDLALGTALGAIFSSLAASGEDEPEFGAMAAAAAVGDELKMNLISENIARLLVEPIYMIPGVPSAVGHKDQFEEVLAFVISSTASLNPKLVVGSAGQYIAGAVITTVTEIVCEGKVPVGGPKLWQGEQG